MNRRRLFFIVVVLILGALIASMAACSPVEKTDIDKHPIIDNDANAIYKDHTTQQQAIDQATDSLNNLLAYLDGYSVSSAGYYVGTNLTINTQDGSAFQLILKANLYTYPYEDEDGYVDEAALAIHNELIKNNDIIIEWYNRQTNELLLGFYFDGLNPNSADPGNVLYLNIQGDKRYFPGFGDTVLYQQIIRLITQFSIESVIASTSPDDNSDSALTNLKGLLELAVGDKYVKTVNGEENSIYFYDLNLSQLKNKITAYIQSIFAPFGDKLDPLTFKYLGFLFSTLGTSEIASLTTDALFVMEENEKIGEEILNRLVMDVEGTAIRYDKNKNTGITESSTIPFTALIDVEYNVKVSTDIKFDKSNYKLFENGKFEFTGDMFIPALDLKLDVLLRTDVNRFDNAANRVFMQCRDIATDNLMMGIYYKNELTYLDIEGITELYGGIAWEDIGLPKAYKDGIDLSDLLMKLHDFIDRYIVLLVDNILDGDTGDSQFGNVTKALMDNITSTMKDEDDPSSRASIMVSVTIELIRKLMSESSENGSNYTNEQIIEMINSQFDIDIEEIASILGLSVNELINTTTVNITYFVDEYSIRIEVYSAAEKLTDEESDLVLRLDLYPQKFGEEVKIAFPEFDNFNELQDILTYSATMNGEFIFASTEEVNMSSLLGSFMCDVTGLNTPYILPDGATIYFELTYDQYIRDQFLKNGRWTRSSRSAVILSFYVVENDVKTKILNVYANDVSFNTNNPVEKLGYIWLEYVCVPDLPLFKMREDYFLKSFYEYMGYDFTIETDNIVMGITDIVQALMEDSVIVFEPEVIRVTTSNDTVKDFFKVDDLIANIDIRIGFKQLVDGIDQLEKNFAMYTVGTFTDISGESPYSIKLHETVPVYFDYGTGDGSEVLTKNLKIAYDPETTAVVAGQTYYRPSIDGLFMGVVRDYLVRITVEIGKQPIRELVDDYYEWEPLDDIPETVLAYYGTELMSAYFSAKYNLHAVYDRATGFYTIINDFGYEIVYDYKNGVYVIGLGTAGKYDNAYTLFDDGARAYKMSYTNEYNLDLVYDLGSGYVGYYIVKNPADYDIVYSYDFGVYVVGDASYYNEAVALLGSGAKVYVKQINISYTAGPETLSRTWYYDFSTGYYAAIVNETVTTGSGTTIVEHKVLFNPANNYYYVAATETISVMRTLLSDSHIITSYNGSPIVWSSAAFAKVDWAGEAFAKIDKNGEIYKDLIYTNISWDDITLEGGKFIVQVVIGDGMMATFRQNVEVKIINRTVDTDTYVIVNTENGLVLVPVADSLEVDPYLYLIYKAYYVNSLEKSPDTFVEWFFSKYLLTIQFTEIYGGQEDTPDATDYYSCSFDYDNDYASFIEKNINNRGTLNNNPLNYIYTVFHKQLIAFRVDVLYREYAYVLLPGETEINTYTIDALESDTYTLPNDLVYYFKGKIYDEASGDYIDSYYKLDFKNITRADDNANDNIYSIFSTLPAAMPLITGNISGGTGNTSPLIDWTDPRATRVVLEGNSGQPFVGKDTNVTTSFLNFAGYFDKNKNWYYTDWFASITVSLKVEVPDKTVGTFSRTVYHGTTSDDVTAVDYSDIYNILAAPYYNAYNNIGLHQSDRFGIWYIDPFNRGSWTLPSQIYVYFDDGAVEGVNQYAVYSYQVTWYSDQACTIPFILNENDIGLNSDSYRLYCRIGDVDVNYITLKLLVIQRSGYAQSVRYLNAGGGELQNPAGASLIYNEATSETYESPKPYTTGTTYTDTQETYYIYCVDTYARFEIPAYIEVTFADGSVRRYAVSWQNVEPYAADPEALGPWKANTVTDIYAVLGNAGARTANIYLTVDVLTLYIERGTPVVDEGTEPDYLTKIALNNSNGAASSTVRDEVNKTDTFTMAGLNPQLAQRVTINYASKTIIVSGITLTVYDYADVRGGYIATDIAGTVFNLAPYDYFDYLFRSLTATFKYPLLPELSITDAVWSAYNETFGLFNVQFAIDNSEIYAAGGTLKGAIDIYIGQGVYADDYKVYFVVDSFELASKASSIENFDLGTVELKAYNSDNTPKYPNGYRIADYLSDFTVSYQDGRAVTYRQGVNIPVEWSVSARPGNNDLSWTDKANWMIGYDKYDIVTTISLEAIYMGGSLWLSAMLPDGSRVYIHFISDATVIGSDYDGADPASPFEVKNGLLTVYNIYKFYPLGNYLLNANLPHTVSLGFFTVSNIVWTIRASTATLNAINNNGTAEDILLATAVILREEVSLYLRVLPCVVQQVYYSNPAADQSRWFTSEPFSAEEGGIVVNIDQYANYNYYGSFVLPSQLSLLYAGRSGEANVAHTTTNNVYYRLSTGTTVSTIPYTLASQDVYVYFTLADGQQVNLRIHFYDKTNPTIDDVFLDPYTENINIPTTVTVRFGEDGGRNYVYSPTWTVDPEFEVKYDTYQRVLMPRDNKYFVMAASLSYGGMAAQTVYLNVYVTDRIMSDGWKLSETQATKDYITSYSSPNASYHYAYSSTSDLFKAAATDIPQTVSYESWMGALGIVWNFQDASITAAGTVGSYILITGHVYNASRGQPISIKVYMDKWEYSDIKKLQNGVYQSMAADIRFFFSEITGKSSYSTYEVAFKVTNAVTGAVTYPKFIFIPNDITPSQAIPGADATYPYRLNWNEEALGRARSTAAGATGGFYLANASRAVKITPAVTATYQYESPTIMEVDLGYGFGAEDNAIYILNPLNPLYSPDENNPYVLAIKARLIYLTDSIEVGGPDDDIVAELLWRGLSGTDVLTVDAAFLGGGAVYGYSVYIRLTKKSDPTYNFAARFGICLVYLDMSPTTSITSEGVNILPNARIKTTYNESSYTGAVNPYRELYPSLIDSLNSAVATLRLANATVTYTVSAWSTTSYTTGGTTTTYSRTVIINGRTYQSDIVKRVINHQYSITAVDLGYGPGSNSIAEDGTRAIYVIDPLDVSFAPQERFGTVVSPYVTRFTSESTTMSVTGSGFNPGTIYTYEITWWNESENGALVFSDSLIAGGVIDHWTIYISVYSGGTLVYRQSFGIMLVFFDGTPVSAPYYTTTGNLFSSLVNDNYTATTYAGKVNPYGDNYTKVMAALNSASGYYSMSIKSYTYEVREWGEAQLEIKDGITRYVQYSTVIKVGGREYQSSVVSRYWT